jgi:hypothetical protein
MNLDSDIFTCQIFHRFKRILTDFLFQKAMMTFQKIGIILPLK